MATSNIDVLLAEAQKAYQAGDVARMRALIKEALAVDPKNSNLWLLATYATDNPTQQRQFIDRAKQLKRTDARILMREKELFPDVDNGFSFVPDAPLTQPQSNTPRPPATPPTKQATLSPTDHIPAWEDAVKLTPRRQLRSLIVLIPVGIIVLIGILFVLSQSRLSDTPGAVVLRFYPALQARDNTALTALLSDDAKALCGDDLAQCLHVSADDFQNYSIAGENLSDNAAVVRLQIARKNGEGAVCQDFLVTNTPQGWRIQKDMTGVGSCATPMASLPGQGLSAVAISVQSDNLPTMSRATEQVTEIAGLSIQQGTLAAAGKTAIAASTAYVFTQTAVAAVPTLTAVSIQAKVSQFFSVGQTWQGEAIENGNDHYPMNLKVTEINGTNIDFEITWPAFGNTVTRAEGTSIVDWTTSSDLNDWKQISGFDPSTAQVGLRFTEKSFIKGNGVMLGLTYLAETTDGKTLNGIWNIIGSHGTFILTRIQ